MYTFCDPLRKTLIINPVQIKDDKNQELIFEKLAVAKDIEKKQHPITLKPLDPSDVIEDEIFSKEFRKKLELFLQENPEQTKEIWWDHFECQITLVSSGRRSKDEVDLEIEQIKLFLASGISIDEPIDGQNVTAIQTAVAYNKQGLFDFLVKNGATLTSDLLFWSELLNLKHFSKFLLEKKFKIDKLELQEWLEYNLDLIQNFVISGISQNKIANLEDLLYKEPFNLLNLIAKNKILLTACLGALNQTSSIQRNNTHHLLLSSFISETSNEHILSIILENQFLKLYPYFLYVCEDDKKNSMYDLIVQCLANSDKERGYKIDKEKKFYFLRTLFFEYKIHPLQKIGTKSLTNLFASIGEAEICINLFKKYPNDENSLVLHILEGITMLQDVLYKSNINERLNEGSLRYLCDYLVKEKLALETLPVENELANWARSPLKSCLIKKFTEIQQYNKAIDPNLCATIFQGLRESADRPDSSICMILVANGLLEELKKIHEILSNESRDIFIQQILSELLDFEKKHKKVPENQATIFNWLLTRWEMPLLEMYSDISITDLIKIHELSHKIKVGVENWRNIGFINIKLYLEELISLGDINSVILLMDKFIKCFNENQQIQASYQFTLKNISVLNLDAVNSNKIKFINCDDLLHSIFRMADEFLSDKKRKRLVIFEESKLVPSNKKTNYGKDIDISHLDTVYPRISKNIKDLDLCVEEGNVCDPILQTLIIHPVQIEGDSTGLIYEKYSIERWIRENPDNLKNPFTGTPITSNSIIEDRAFSEEFYNKLKKYLEENSNQRNNFWQSHFSEKIMLVNQNSQTYEETELEILQIKLLLDSGIEIDMPVNNTQDTAISNAIKCGKHDLAIYLLERGAAIRTEFLYWSTLLSLIEITQVLEKKGLKIVKMDFDLWFEKHEDSIQDIVAEYIWKNKIDLIQSILYDAPFNLIDRMIGNKKLRIKCLQALHSVASGQYDGNYMYFLNRIIQKLDYKEFLNDIFENGFLKFYTPLWHSLSYEEQQDVCYLSLKEQDPQFCRLAPANKRILVWKLIYELEVSPTLQYKKITLIGLAALFGGLELCFNSLKSAISNKENNLNYIKKLAWEMIEGIVLRNQEYIDNSYPWNAAQHELWQYIKELKLFDFPNQDEINKLTLEINEYPSLQHLEQINQYQKTVSAALAVAIIEKLKNIDDKKNIASICHWLLSKGILPDERFLYKEITRENNNYLKEKPSSSICMILTMKGMLEESQEIFYPLSEEKKVFFIQQIILTLAPNKTIKQVSSAEVNYLNWLLRDCQIPVLVLFEDGFESSTLLNCLAAYGLREEIKYAFKTLKADTFKLKQAYDSLMQILYWNAYKKYADQEAYLQIIDWLLEEQKIDPFHFPKFFQNCEPISIMKICMSLCDRDVKWVQRLNKIIELNPEEALAQIIQSIKLLFMMTENRFAVVDKVIEILIEKNMGVITILDEFIKCFNANVALQENNPYTLTMISQDNLSNLESNLEIIKNFSSINEKDKEIIFFILTRVQEYLIDETKKHSSMVSEIILFPPPKKPRSDGPDDDMMIQKQPSIEGPK